MTKNEKVLYYSLFALNELIDEYLKESINVKVRELSMVRTYSRKAMSQMQVPTQVDIKILKTIENRTKELYELANLKDKDKKQIWLSETDRKYMININVLSALVIDCLENMKSIDKKLKTSLKYLRTYSNKFFEMVEETAPLEEG